MITTDGQKLILTGSGERLTVEAWGESALRVRAYHEGASLSEDWALLPREAPGMPQIRTTPEGAEITNGKLTCFIGIDGRLRFLNARGEPLFEEVPVSPVLKFPSREIKPQGAGYKIALRLTAREDEKFTGMGQYQHGRLNLKGMQLELAQRNSQASVPFVVSSRNYGLLWNNPAVGTATFARDMTVFEAGVSRGIDYWVTAGDSPAEVLAHYAGATGRPPMMPDWATGFWQSKLRYASQAELLSIAREFRRRGLPLSALVIDFFHWTEQGDWKFDETCWPDVEAMAAELRGMGVEPVASVWPTVSVRSENFEEMRGRNFLLSVDRGVQCSMEFSGSTLFYDATNPDARRYVWDKVKRNYFDRGVRAYWLDAVEPEFTEYDFDNYRYSAGPAAMVGNAYPMLCGKAFYDGLTEAGVENPLSLTRCGWAGSQRYGALIWSGDIPSTFDSLRRQVAAGLNMAMAGIPWWTTDIGGFEGGDIGDSAFRELVARWFAYGVYCPVMRLHGHRVARDAEGKPVTGADNEPWSFGPEAYEIIKACLVRREALRGYAAEQMRRAHETGAPVMRPLLYDFPEDQKCWEIEDQYMFGPDYLVAPVLSPGVSERRVYLPLGAAWTDERTGKTCPGGREVTAAAPLDAIPVYRRAPA